MSVHEHLMFLPPCQCTHGADVQPQMANQHETNSAFAWKCCCAAPAQNLSPRTALKQAYYKPEEDFCPTFKPDCLYIKSWLRSAGNFQSSYVSQACSMYLHILWNTLLQSGFHTTAHELAWQIFLVNFRNAQQMSIQRLIFNLIWFYLFFYDLKVQSVQHIHHSHIHLHKFTVVQMQQICFYVRFILSAHLEPSQKYN